MLHFRLEVGSDDWIDVLKKNDEESPADYVFPTLWR